MRRLGGKVAHVTCTPVSCASQSCQCSISESNNPATIDLTLDDSLSESESADDPQVLSFSHSVITSDETR